MIGFMWAQIAFHCSSIRLDTLETETVFSPTKPFFTFTSRLHQRSAATPGSAKHSHSNHVSWQVACLTLCITCRSVVLPHLPWLQSKVFQSRPDSHAQTEFPHNNQDFHGWIESHGIKYCPYGPLHQIHPCGKLDYFRNCCVRFCSIFLLMTIPKNKCQKGNQMLQG